MNLPQRVPAVEEPQVKRRIVLSLDQEPEELRPSAAPAGGLGGVAQLVALLETNPDYQIRIEGYTDSVGNGAYNQRLSQHRAEIVREALVQHGAEATRISAIGRGEAAPVASNATAEGRQQNRRIEVSVVAVTSPARLPAQLASN